MFLFIAKRIWKGEGLGRALMHLALQQHSYSGRVVDLGGGHSPRYFSIMKQEGAAQVEALDLSFEDQRRIDFESGTLPQKNMSVDMVTAFNLLEHLYNYNHLLAEGYRILRPGGRLLGVVPFMNQYHPDPHDYFRFTKDSLARMLTEVGFQEVVIQEIGRGPFAVNYNNIVFSFPRLLMLCYLPFSYFLDSVFLYLRPGVRKRYPLGYLFTAKK